MHVPDARVAAPRAARLLLLLQALRLESGIRRTKVHGVKKMTIEWDGSAGGGRRKSGGVQARGKSPVG
jgi:hypothetical protein